MKSVSQRDRFDKRRLLIREPDLSEARVDIDERSLARRIVLGSPYEHRHAANQHQIGIVAQLVEPRQTHAAAVVTCAIDPFVAKAVESQRAIDVVGRIVE